MIVIVFTYFLNIVVVSQLLHMSILSFVYFYSVWKTKLFIVTLIKSYLVSYHQYDYFQFSLFLDNFYIFCAFPSIVLFLLYLISILAYLELICLFLRLHSVTFLVHQLSFLQLQRYLSGSASDLSDIYLNPSDALLLIICFTLYQHARQEEVSIVWEMHIGNTFF